MEKRSWFRRCRAALWLPAAALLPMAGCLQDDVLIRDAASGERRSYGEISDNGQLSAASGNLLANLMLQDAFQEDPVKVIRLLEQASIADARPEYLLALTDLAFTVGTRRSDPDAAASAFLSALLYAGNYLAALDKPDEAPYQPERLRVMRLYNQSLTELFAYLRERNLLFHTSYQMLTLTGRRVRFLAPDFRLPLPVTAFDDIQLCADFRPDNLTHVSYRFGLGTPLVFKLKDEVRLGGARVFPGQTLPVTVAAAFAPDGEGSRNCTVRLHYFSTLNEEHFPLAAGRNVPLELDYSTPLAYMTRRPPLFDLLTYTFQPSATERMQGLYLLQPYDPKRIPVLLVHGLMSNPRTWVQMVNTLQNDPEIRRHYQFWGFSYSSGNPVLYSAQLLRRALDALVAARRAEPGGAPMLDRMVVVGHSMGGLLSKTLIMDSDYAAVGRALGIPVEELREELTAEQKAFLDEMLVFSARPYVRRVVFIAVPHQGSALASGMLGRFGAKMIELPRALVDSVWSLRQSIRAFYGGELDEETVAAAAPLATGIDNLNPGNDSLKLLNALPFAPTVPYHSIIGNRRKGDTLGGGDGVVPYSSSHLDGAASELIVKSGHSVQQNPLAIMELRRILLEHLRQYPDIPKPVRAVNPLLGQ